MTSLKGQLPDEDRRNRSQYIEFRVSDLFILYIYNPNCGITSVGAANSTITCCVGM